MIDLHLHSTASDGTFSPAKLVEHAHNLRIDAIGLTDHDTTSGIDEAIYASKNSSIVVIPGVELSATPPLDDKIMHIIGLYIDHNDQRFQEVMNDLVQMRKTRNPKIIKKLNELGIEITIEEVEKVASTNVVGRPHIAQVLMDKKIVKSTSDAFNKYLGEKAPASIPKQRLSAEDAIQTIKKAGGVPILAHPDQLKLKPSQLRSLLGDLTDMGLEGIETFCAAYSPNQISKYSRLANQFKLVRSGGSDFHGRGNAISIGTGTGRMFIPNEILTKIKQRQLKINSSN